MSLFDKASLIVTPNGYKASKLYSVIPSTGAGDMDVTRATTATRVNSTGLIESVANNVPRLDYTNSSCPSILVEPQRTNNILYSEQIDNILWLKNAATISANATTSPSGTLTGDKIVEDTTNDAHYIDIRPVVLNSLHTCSIYVKAAGRTKFQLREGSNGDLVTFDLASPSGNIESVGNDWYRVWITTTPASVTFIFQLRLLDNSGNLVYTGNGTSGLFVWGGQLETGSYRTSYIPTTTASVTRNADVISKTGISSLIGQTEGTIFCDFNFKQGIESFILGVGNGSYFNNLAIECYSNKAYLTIFNNSASLQGTIETTTLSTAKHKIAVAYNSTQVIVYLDGVSVGTLGAVTFPSFNNFYLGNLGSDTNPKIININSAQIYKTRLTNAELATLTTI
jgi:hypothetical protein